jgi:hypothetical protein
VLYLIPADGLAQYRLRLYTGARLPQRLIRIESLPEPFDGRGIEGSHRQELDRRVVSGELASQEAVRLAYEVGLICPRDAPRLPHEVSDVMAF